MDGRLLNHQEEQIKWLQDASNSVKRNAFYMKRALDEDNLREALRYSAALLGELRTSLLTPQKYFELYMQASDELRQLEAFFQDEQRKGRSLADLYELVQHAGNVLPRLYLLCTVGACFIRSKEAHAKDILKDLVEVCKGVQHPTRGLFLRSYLCQVSRGLLPDTGSEYEGEGGNVNDALEFLLANFTEMNKLWVRMQHQGSDRDKDRREKERQQLADLVGKNLTYISQLEGLDFELYKTVVHPRCMEQIISCKDDIAQQYLMQCIIQCFPDEFHLGTLSQLIGALPDLQLGVKVHTIFSSLLDRLARYAASSPEVRQQIDAADAFGVPLEGAALVAVQHAEMPTADVAGMFIALAQFANSVYPDRLDYMDRTLASCAQALAPRAGVTDDKAEKQLVLLLSAPLDKYDVVTVLGLSNYPKVMNLLAPATRKEMAVKLVQTILRQGTQVGSKEKVEMLFDFIVPLVEDIPGVSSGDEEDIEEEQGLIARLVHHLVSDNPDEQFEVLQTARERLSRGGPVRLKYTLPPVVFSALSLVRLIKERDSDAESSPQGATPKAVLQFVHGVIAQLADTGASAELALALFLDSAISAADVACLELIAYEFFEQAFILYEEAIPDSNAERTALQSIVGALQRTRIFTPESRDTLVHKATGYSAKLLKKVDQCRAVCACSHLFWQEASEAGKEPEEATPSGAKETLGEDSSPPSTEGNGNAPTEDADPTAAPAAPNPKDADPTAAPNPKDADPTAAPNPKGSKQQSPVRDPEKVMVCLKRALKIAHAAQQQLTVALKTSDTQPVALFVEILNHYVYYFEQGLPSISTNVLQSLMELVSNEMANENCQKDPVLLAFYNNTIAHIQHVKALGGDTAKQFEGLQI